MGPLVYKEFRLDFVWEHVSAGGGDSVTDGDHLVWTSNTFTVPFTAHESDSFLLSTPAPITFYNVFFFFL